MRPSQEYGELNPTCQASDTGFSMNSCMRAIKIQNNKMILHMYHHHKQNLKKIDSPVKRGTKNLQLIREDDANIKHLS